MIQIVFIVWIAIALLMLYTRELYRILIYFCIFSMITSFCFLVLGATDVAMAEAAIGVFTTIFFIICFERHYNLNTDTPSKPYKDKISISFKKYIPHVLFTGALFGLFLYFRPDAAANPHLKEQYISTFMDNIVGDNPVTAIYLKFRVYDTLFEALVLVISVVAVSHMSWYDITSTDDGQHSEIEDLGMAVFTTRIICPVILVFGLFLIINGQFSPGGGFQGGLAIAVFFICRYMIFDIYDLPINKVIRMEELLFASTIVLAIFVVFQNMTESIPDAYLPRFQSIYLMSMNVLIGMKVACAFFLLFYRYIAIERS